MGLVSSSVDGCWGYLLESWTKNATSNWMYPQLQMVCLNIWDTILAITDVLWSFVCKQSWQIQLCVLFMGFISIVLLLLRYSRKGESTRSSAESKIPDVSSWSVFDLAKTAYQPGHTEAITMLVDQFGYDVNYIIPSTGLSLFLCTCLSGERAAIQYMLKKGADINSTSQDGDTPLYLATFGILNSVTPEVAVLTDLMEAGCDVNKANFRGYTPLHRAASKGSVPVIKCLLTYGADPYQASKAGILPIGNAINAGNLKAAEFLKIHIDNPHVWEVVDPHTPPRIQLGLQSPRRKHLIESSRPNKSLSILNT
ncbi:serine/threonine-protein phosphatase 6 regulatory ankyrin repeat subunit C-like [Pecten maximus]|uniref:serine/threonine-protein phosphatase 6 regulatory ankyrin repeat subunit C-like n=1 Tax=Pecten maximus TaxID=6579 RepID=UPI0014582123|nr:serine/threonine-protein phosphatase 6 regulatory ankyrin repeat subunit C-like [Pecten maximus]